MSKFKIGDELKVVNAPGFRSFDNGKVAKITANEGLWEEEQSWWGQGWTYRHKESELELVHPSPIVTETVTRIEPGVYGRLSISKQHSEDGRRVLIGLANEIGVVGNPVHGWSFDELSAAIEVLTAVKTHLESQKP